MISKEAPTGGVGLSADIDDGRGGAGRARPTRHEGEQDGQRRQEGQAVPRGGTTKGG